MFMPNDALDLLAAYGQMMGLPSLKFNEQGCARLMFDDTVAVDLEIDEPGNCVHLYSVLGPVPPGDNHVLYRQLLEGNLFGQQTGGALLAVDGTREDLLVCSRVGLPGATPAGLALSIDALAGAARDWQQRLASGALQAGEGTDAQPPPMAPWQSFAMRG